MGDVVAILVFAAAGRAAHGEEGNPVLHAAFVAAPFLIGWFVAAVPLGAYRPPVLQSTPTAISCTAVAWLVGGTIGLAIRSAIEGRVVPPAFVAVALGFVLVLLVLWRAALTAALHLSSRRA